MDRGKKLDVSAATIVDLKAELFRKREASKQDQLKQRSASASATSLKLGRNIRPEVDNLGKSNPGLKLRLSKDNESRVIDDEERDALSRSRQKLEEKAKLYDKLSREPVDADEEDDSTYMVDFQRKALKKWTATTATRTTTREDETDASEQVSDDWVDYTDSLGRSRKCLRQDLPKMVEMDLDLQRSRPVVPPTKSENVGVPPSEDGQYVNMAFPSFATAKRDPEPVVSDTPIGPVHYQNVQFNEIRSHGTGYFAFSQSETERKEQMVTLNALRDQTRDQRVRNEKLKEKRKLMLAARLAKVKQRKKLKSGAVSSSDSNDESDDEITLSTNTAEIEKSEEVFSVDDKKMSNPPVPVRPWDRGKIGVSRITQPFKKASQKQWVEVEREKRPQAFAPPQSYYADDQVEHMHQFFKEQAELVSQPVPEAESASTTTPPPPPGVPMWSVPPPFHPGQPPPSHPGMPPYWYPPPVNQHHQYPMPPGLPPWNATPRLSSTDSVDNLANACLGDHVGIVVADVPLPPAAAVDQR